MNLVIPLQTTADLFAYSMIIFVDAIVLSVLPFLFAGTGFLRRVSSVL